MINIVKVPKTVHPPDGNVQAMQQFIGQSPWEYAPVRKRPTGHMAGELLPAAAWTVDDSGFPEQGKHSVGVSQQYSGTLGKVGNCRVAVSLYLATDEVCMPLDFDLYLPKSWTDDPERVKKLVCRPGGLSGPNGKSRWI